MGYLKIEMLLANGEPKIINCNSLEPLVQAEGSASRFRIVHINGETEDIEGAILKVEAEAPAFV